MDTHTWLRARLSYIIMVHNMTRNLCLFQSADSEEELEQCVAGLVRVEKTDFVQPMFIGEVAELHAEITHTAFHSMEVQVKVWAEDILKGEILEKNTMCEFIKTDPH